MADSSPVTHYESRIRHHASHLRRAAFAWGPPLVYMALIFGLSAQHRLPRVGGIFDWDKLQHVSVYGALGLLLLRAGRLAPIGRRIGPHLMSLIIALAYGAFDELHQGFVPGRDMSVFDWLADAVGVAIALVGAAVLARRRNTTSVKPESFRD